jgi:diguanylate cyclase
MRDAPWRRPDAEPSPPPLPLVAAGARVLVVAAAVALVSAVGGPGAAWMAVPAALLLSAPSSSRPQAAGGTAAAVLAAWAPQAAEAPPPLLMLVVAATSVAILNAVQRRLEAERESMRRSALRDPLTGASNRRGLEERMSYEVARHARERRRFAVVAIDLDGFKGVNDRFGHPAGDEVLRDVAAALAGAVREQDTVARLGGDEFCVLAPETDRQGGAHLAAKVDRAIRAATAGIHALSGSVGVAVFPDDGRDGLSILEAADAAQVAAKRRLRAA